jgi:hypothetical protein
VLGVTKQGLYNPMYWPIPCTKRCDIQQIEAV